PAGGGARDYYAFTDSLTSAFQPQRFLNPQGGLGTTGSAVGNFLGSSVLGPVVGILAVTLTFALIVIVLGALCVMLLIRYVVLSFLMVTAPFAWLLWIFPNTKKYFSQWWDVFIRWTFFFPLVLFSMWLVVQVGHVMHQNTTLNPLYGVQTNFQSTS